MDWRSDGSGAGELSLRVDAQRIETLEIPYRDERARRLVAGWRGLPQAALRQFRSYYFINPPKWRVALRKLSAQERVVPDFASIGAVRSGTSFLSSYIFQHPQLVLPLAKEISFTQTQRDFLAHFPTRAEAEATRRATGGAITGYCTPVVPNPLWIHLYHAMFPQMRIVCTLRDPVERVFSHWRWDEKRALTRRKRDPYWRGYPDFATLVAEEMATIRDGGMETHALTGARAGYLRHGIYAPFLRLLFEKIGRERVFVVDAAEFFADPAAMTKRVYRFLDLPEVEPHRIAEKNAGPPGDLPDSLRRELAAFYRPYNDATYQLLGRELGWMTA